MKDDDRLIYLLTVSFHRLGEHLKMRYADAGLRITPVQAGVLLLLRGGESLSMGDIGRAFHVDKSAVTGMVDRLERGGFLARVSEHGDRRIRLIRITEEGKNEIDRALPIIRETNSAIRKGFSAGEIGTFRRVLAAFFEKFEIKNTKGMGVQK